MPGRPLLVRAVLGFLALPGVVAIAGPLALAWITEPALSFRPIALIPIAAGLALLFWCARDFYAAGHGTLAPWDPPRRLVVGGPYRVSRNPMYLAVGVLLLGWAIGFASWALVIYFIAFEVAAHLRVVVGEEPFLARTHTAEWVRYSKQVPRWMFRSRRAVLLTIAALFAAAPLAGLVYEAAADARATAEFPPPGMLVDIGGRRLHLLCIGEGSPTVLIAPSGFSNAMSNARVRDRVSARTTVCSYDRAGMGWSDPGPSTTTAGALARDLAVLQDRAKLRGPFLLVGASIGGLTVEMFARQYPERVAGLVLVDAATSPLLAGLSPRLDRVPTMTCLARAAAWLGVVRLLDPFGLAREGTDEARRSAALTYGGKPFDSLCALARGLAASGSEFDAAPPLPKTPTVVLSASSDTDLVPPGFESYADGMRPMMNEAHKALASSTGGTWQTVPDSTHLIMSSQPDVVADAILGLVR